MTYYKRLFFLMIIFSLLNCVIVYFLTFDIELSSLIFLVTCVIQVFLVFVLGRFKFFSKKIYTDSGNNSSNNLILDKLILANNNLVNAVYLIENSNNSKDDIKKLKVAISSIDFVLSDH